MGNGRLPYEQVVEVGHRRARAEDRAEGTRGGGEAVGVGRRQRGGREPGLGQRFPERGQA